MTDKKPLKGYYVTFTGTVFVEAINDEEAAEEAMNIIGDIHCLEDWELGDIDEVDED